VLGELLISAVHVAGLPPFSFSFPTFKDPKKFNFACTSNSEQCAFSFLYSRTAAAWESLLCCNKQVWCLLSLLHCTWGEWLATEESKETFPNKQKTSFQKLTFCFHFQGLQFISKMLSYSPGHNSLALLLSICTALRQQATSD
jgi:hypothetical protein